MTENAPKRVTRRVRSQLSQTPIDFYPKIVKIRQNIQEVFQSKRSRLRQESKPEGKPEIRTEVSTSETILPTRLSSLINPKPNELKRYIKHSFFHPISEEPRVPSLTRRHFVSEARHPRMSNAFVRGALGSLSTRASQVLSSPLKAAPIELPPASVTYWKH